MRTIIRSAGKASSLIPIGGIDDIIFGALEFINRDPNEPVWKTTAKVIGTTAAWAYASPLMWTITAPEMAMGLAQTLSELSVQAKERYQERFNPVQSSMFFDTTYSQQLRHLALEELSASLNNIRSYQGTQARKLHRVNPMPEVV